MALRDSKVVKSKKLGKIVIIQSFASDTSIFENSHLKYGENSKTGMV